VSVPGLTSPATLGAPGFLNIYGTADQTRSICFFTAPPGQEEIHTINSVIGLYSHNNNARVEDTELLLRALKWHGGRPYGRHLHRLRVERAVHLPGRWLRRLDLHQPRRQSAAAACFATDENWDHVTTGRTAPSTGRL
jgi:hypothetical protein